MHGYPMFLLLRGARAMPTIEPISDLCKTELKLDLFSKLAIAQSQMASSDKGRTLQQVMKDIKQRLK
jgi:hypothetical protein